MSKGISLTHFIDHTTHIMSDTVRWRQQILDSLSKYSWYPKMIVDLTLLAGTPGILRWSLI